MASSVVYPAGTPEDWSGIRGKPYITVSANGLANGLSDIPNDGADFGPDTLLGATSPDQYGPPYSQTGGLQEANNYLNSLKDVQRFGSGTDISQSLIMKILPGVYYLNASLNISQYVSLEGTDGNTNGTGAMILANNPNVTITFGSSNAQWFGHCENVYFGSYYDPTQLTVTFITIYGGHYFKNNTVNGDAYNQSVWGQTTLNIIGSAVIVVEGNVFGYGQVKLTGGTNNTFWSDNLFDTFNGVELYLDNTTSANYFVNNHFGDSGSPRAQYIIQDLGNYNMFESCSFHSSGSSSEYAIYAGGSSGRYTGTILGSGNTTTLSNGIYDAGTDNYFDFTFYLLSGYMVNLAGTNGYYRIGGNYTGTTPITGTGTGIIEALKSITLPPPSTPTVPASGTAQQNTNPFSVEVALYGGVVSEIQITRKGTTYTVFSNSSGAALSGQEYRLDPGDSITLTYTTAPTWVWLPA